MALSTATASPFALWLEEPSTRPNRRKIRARIGGLHCSLCTGTIEKALGRMPGVDKASVIGRASRLTPASRNLCPGICGIRTGQRRRRQCAAAQGHGRQSLLHLETSKAPSLHLCGIVSDSSIRYTINVSFTIILWG